MHQHCVPQGGVNVEHFEEALLMLMRRHDTLTSISVMPGALLAKAELGAVSDLASELHRTAAESLFKRSESPLDAWLFQDARGAAVALMLAVDADAADRMSLAIILSVRQSVFL